MKMKMLKSLDFFGPAVNLYFENDMSISSLFGGILSLLYFSLTIGLFFIFGNDFITKSNPSVIKSEFYDDKSSIKTIS